MRFPTPRDLLAGALLAAILTGCGTPSPSTVETDPRERTVTTTAVDQSERIEAVRYWHAVQLFEATRQWNATVEEIREAERRAAATVTPTTVAAAWPVSLQPCGGDLPPCYVAQRESGGDYAAVNWGGCGGHNCYGKWQFSGAWACRLGLPCDLLRATPEQQDNAARMLWDHGAGCSHWAAC